MATRFEARGRFAVPPERLWPYLSDTHRMNRAMGLPVMRFQPEPLATGGSRVIGEHPLGSAVVGFLVQLGLLAPRRATSPTLLRWLPAWPIARWIEHPFEFAAPRRYSVLREYFWSPLGLFPFRSVRPTVVLTPTEDGGTEVVASADVEARNPQGALLTRMLLGPRSCSAVIAQCRNFERYLLGRAPHPFPELVLAGDAADEPLAPPNGRGSAESQAGQRPLADAWGRLLASGVAPAIADAMRRHLERAPDDEVLKMRPFELADRWGFDRRETLIAFLHATTAGLVEMSWDVLCPGCRISKFSTGSLAELRGEVHCDFCNVSFDATIDRQVEVRFSVSPALRTVEDRRFCSGGPMNTPHLLAQAEIAPGAACLLDAVLAPGTYRLRSLQSKTTALIEVLDERADGAGEVAVAVDASAILPPAASAPAGAVRLRAENRAAVPVVLVLEEPRWPDTAATASVVSTLQEFRDLFGAEVLAPGLQLAIQRLAFLFTDLTGSTALYQAVGQARAFRLVQDHFGLLFEAVRANRGAVVKTIGDAVMAAFPTGADAVAAGLAMQRAIRGLDTGGAVDPARLLKIGIHEGPCIAVTANERLDYFGTTINTAARVEHECRGGQIVITSAVHDDPAVTAALRDAVVAVEPFEVRLRGIAEPVQLYRLPDPVGAGAPVPA